jgi:hypothetical protein
VQCVDVCWSWFFQDGSDEDEREESSSDVEDDLVQRLKSLNSPNDPDTLTRLPVRISPAAHQDDTDANQDSPPASADDGPAEVSLERCVRLQVARWLLWC